MLNNTRSSICSNASFINVLRSQDNTMIEVGVNVDTTPVYLSGQTDTTEAEWIVQGQQLVPFVIKDPNIEPSGFEDMRIRKECKEMFGFSDSDDLENWKYTLSEP